MSRTLIITGMHRSGTSVVAGLVQRAGLYVGERLMPGDVANPRGYLEDLDFYELHRQILQKRGRHYFDDIDDPFTGDPEEQDRARELIAARRSRPLWGWKDPRTCLFLDFWAALLPEARFLFLYRPPLDVLLSLIRRREPGMADLYSGLDAWHRYNSRIERFCRRHREHCLLGNVYAVLDHIDEFGRHLSRLLGTDLRISPDDLADGYAPSELRRGPWTPLEFGVLKAIHPAAAEVYRLLNEAADMPAPLGREADAAALTRAAHAMLDQPGAVPPARGLLMMLAAGIDADALERFFTGLGESVRELETAKAWLDTQWKNWQSTAEERLELAAGRGVRIAELEQSHAELQAELARATDERQQLESRLQRWRQSGWGRLGRRLGFLD